MIWAMNDGDMDAYKYLMVLEGDEIMQAHQDEKKNWEGIPLLFTENIQV